jgi:hypothetical protein
MTYEQNVTCNQWYKHNMQHNPVESSLHILNGIESAKQQASRETTLTGIAA